MKHIFKDKKNIKRAEYFCTSLFFFLCLLHYFSQRPLWGDENFVLENIKNITNIFGPVRNVQTFPRVYLSMFKALGSVFDYSVLSLRFLSLLSMSFAYIIWARIYKKLFGENWQFILGVFAFTSSYYLSYYASEFKPYSMDVLVAGIFTLVLLHQRQWYAKQIPIKFYLIAVLLPLTLFFSYASLFLFWTVGYNCLFIARRNKSIWPLFVVYCCISALCLVMIYNFDLQYSAFDRGLVSYWDSYFVCYTSFGCFFSTFGEGLRRLATFWFGFGKFFMQWATFLIPFFLYSIVRYGIIPWKKDKFRIFSPEAIFAVLMIELLIFALMKRYPFTGERITLFFAPFIFYGIIKAIYDLKRVPILFYFFAWNFVIFLAACYINSLIVYVKMY
jgi:hypothetical protein